MKLKTTLLAAAATMVVAPAAHAYEGLYGAIGAGLNYMVGDQDITNDQVGGGGDYAFDSAADYDLGLGVYAALGYKTAGAWRYELELAYRDVSIDSINADGAGFTGWPAGTIDGDTTAKSALVNLIYDFDNDSSVTPYLGAGVGVVNIDHDIIGNNPAGIPGTSIAYGASGWTLAYQGIAGIAVDLAEGLVFDLSYRYFGTKKDSFAGTLGSPANFETEFTSHNLFAGLRWNFGGAPAAAPQYKDCWDGSSVPVSSACPPQVIEDTAADVDPLAITVYFDYDKSNLTAEASTLIREAAARALENDINTVVVSGNTDTSGSSAYNQALSERRARAVRDALVANGVPADSVRMEALGETNLAKPTPDGVREPLNRRAEVLITFE